MTLKNLKLLFRTRRQKSWMQVREKLQVRELFHDRLKERGEEPKA